MKCMEMGKKRQAHNNSTHPSFYLIIYLPVLQVVHVDDFHWLALEQALDFLDLLFDVLLDGDLGGVLANFAQVRAGVALEAFGQVLEADVRRKLGLAEGGLENRQSGAVVWHRNVPEDM